jgi:hypothetical protein
MPIDRTAFNAWVDDDGSNTVGTPITKIRIDDDLLDPIDAAIAAAVGATTGNWTPVIGGSGGTSGQTYAAQNGEYIKVDKLVVAAFNVQLSAEGTITGNAQIQGLPYTVDVAGNGASVAIEWQALATNWVSVFLNLGNASTAGDIHGAAAAGTGANTNLTAADIGNGTIFRGTIVYRATT